MRYITLAAMLLATPAMAQQPTLQQQLDSGAATISRIVVGYGNQIAADASQIDSMRAQIAALSKENADLKAKTTDAAH